MPIRPLTVAVLVAAVPFGGIARGAKTKRACALPDPTAQAASVTQTICGRDGLRDGGRPTA